MRITANGEKYRKFKLYNKVIGQNLRRIRIAKGFAQDAIGEKLGISFQQIGKYESGKNRVTAVMLISLAELLECSIFDLLDGIADNKKKPNIDDVFYKSTNLKLIRDYNAIKSPEMKAAVHNFIKSVSRIESETSHIKE